MICKAGTRFRSEVCASRFLVTDLTFGSSSLARATFRGHAFASSSLWGKSWGLHACGATLSYTVPLPNSLPTPLVLKTKIEKEGLPRGSTPALGAGGPRFKSARPDQFLQLQRRPRPAHLQWFLRLVDAIPMRLRIHPTDQPRYIFDPRQPHAWVKMAYNSPARIARTST